MQKTAESVTPKHPDKICDRISDAILDACLEQDPRSRVAIETMGGHGIITITGELTTNAYVDMREIAQRVAGGQYGVQINVVKQSNEIANGVDVGGAGDQGIMVGYACKENDRMIPNEVLWSRDLAQHLYSIWEFDGKTQITTNYGFITTVVASFQNAKSEDLKEEIIKWVKDKPTSAKKAVDNIIIHANPAGDWSVGGFEADTGLTGRKLAVDNYGTEVPIGGGCFSGKDSTKVDRSAAYMARYLACQQLKFTGAKEVYVRLAYAIGHKYPVMVSCVQDGRPVDLHKTILYDREQLTPANIIKFLELKKPVFEETAEWGHFGNKFKWDY